MYITRKQHAARLQKRNIQLNIQLTGSEAMETGLENENSTSRRVLDK